MIQFDKAQGKYRARWEFGHNKYYKQLIREHKKLVKRKNTLLEAEKKVPKSLTTSITSVEYKIHDMESRYGDGAEVNIKTRRSFSTRHKWQAKFAEELFQQAHEYEANGETVPTSLEKEIDSLREAPRRADYLEEVSYHFAAISGFHEEVLNNCDFGLFFSQSDTNMFWLKELEIGREEIRETARKFCAAKGDLKLKGKTFIFTGSFVGFTACEDYIRALATLAKQTKADGIITAGPWIKYIFLHKTASSQEILSSVKKLAKQVKIYAVRSNKEDAELIPKLKDIGIEFLNGIEDEKNLFLNYQFGRISTKDQLGRYRDYDVPKNLFVPTTYVTCEPKLKVNRNFYMIGSGAASFHTPSARIWSNSYDSQAFAAEKYDKIGGHVLRFDNESEVYPSAFFYNHELKSIFLNGKVYSSTRASQGKLHVIVSDGHFSGVHKTGYTALKDFIVKNRKNISSLIFNGDILSNDVLCHWNDGDFSKQFEILQKHKSFLHEVAKTRAMIHELVGLASNGGKNKIRLIYKLGNHEISSFKKLGRKSIVHFLMQMLDLDRLLELSDVGFEMVDGDKPYFIGDVPILHGHELTRPYAHKVLGEKTTIGHSHRGMIDNMGVILPTLEDQDETDYFTYYRRPWAVGWGVITEYKGQTEKPEVCYVHEGKYFDFNKLTKITKPKEIVVPKQITLTYNLE